MGAAHPGALALWGGLLSPGVGAQGDGPRRPARLTRLVSNRRTGWPGLHAHCVCRHRAQPSGTYLVREPFPQKITEKLGLS